MKEVEIKIEIGNADQVLRNLEAFGCKFSAPVSQLDTVFVPADVLALPCPAGTNVLRIRKQGEKFLFTLKRSDAGNHLSKLEHELEILDPKKLESILTELGYKRISIVSKMRRKCKFKEFEVCLDAVEGLGNFLEIETMTDGDAFAAQRDMLKFLAECGIDSAKRAEYGYDVLYFQKHGTGTI